MNSQTIKIEPPYRRRRTAAFRIAAAPDDVFSMMCPVREYEWEPAWRTNIIFSDSGLVEEGCIFTTPAGASIASSADSAEAVWVTPLYDRKARRLTMIKVTPAECVTRLDIAVDETAEGSEVTASYEHTALSEKGRTVVDNHTEAAYGETMKGWRRALERALSARAA